MWNGHSNTQCGTGCQPLSAWHLLRDAGARACTAVQLLLKLNRSRKKITSLCAEVAPGAPDRWWRLDAHTIKGARWRATRCRSWRGHVSIDRPNTTLPSRACRMVAAKNTGTTLRSCMTRCILARAPEMRRARGVPDAAAETHATLFSCSYCRRTARSWSRFRFRHT